MTIEAQRSLRRTTNDLGWQAFLWLDEEYTSRLVTIAIVLVRWAFW